MNNIKKQLLLETVDYTLLKPWATAQDIETLCIDCLERNCRGVCIPPCFVSFAKQFDVKVSTVIGFPFGYNGHSIKEVESRRVGADGADELDVVWNLGNFMDRKYLIVMKELVSIVRLGVPVKVIVEECFLDKYQKELALKIVRDSGAWAIKTSTGIFDGATIETVELWRSLDKDIKIKAAGGIVAIFQAEQFIKAGADIIGSGAKLW